MRHRARLDERLSCWTRNAEADVSAHDCSPCVIPRVDTRAMPGPIALCAAIK